MKAPTVVPVPNSLDPVVYKFLTKFADRVDQVYLDKDFCSLRFAADKTIVTATPTAVVWETAEAAASPNGVLWQAGSRVYARVSGLYIADYQVGWAGSATGYRESYLAVGSSGASATTSGKGSRFALLTQQGNATKNAAAGSALLQLTAGQFIELYVQQTSGGDLALRGDTGTSPEYGCRLQLRLLV